MRRGMALAILVALAGAGSPAQRDRPASGHYSAPIPYDGRVTFVRLRWGSDLPSPRGRFGFRTAWNHDYPRAEQNLAAIIRELSYLDIHDDGNEILMLDDPELFRYPIAFMWEPGFWNLTDREAESFRAYLQKGGFAIFEDFDGAAQWDNFEAQMRRVLPDGRFVRLDNSHQIFNAFFAIKDIDAIIHPMSHIRPSYYGMFEDNDPSKRLMVIANYDNDVPEYWEWSGQGLFPFDASNEAYKLGVNYWMYGLTH